MITLTVQYGVDSDKLPTESQFQHWIDTTLNHLNQSSTHHRELTLRIVSIDESAALNSTYRHKTGPTNVLSFGYDETSILLGDIVICADKVISEAQNQQKSIEAHWAHLTIHGLLHLLGYDHEEESEALHMESIETDVMTSLGYAPPYETPI